MKTYKNMEKLKFQAKKKEVSLARFEPGPTGPEAGTLTPTPSSQWVTFKQRRIRMDQIFSDDVIWRKKKIQ